MTTTAFALVSSQGAERVSEGDSACARACVCSSLTWHKGSASHWCAGILIQSSCCCSSSVPSSRGFWTQNGCTLHTDTHSHRHVSAAAVTVLEGTGGLLGALIDIEKTQMNRLDKQLIKWQRIHVTQTTQQNVTLCSLSRDRRLPSECKQNDHFY